MDYLHDARGIRYGKIASRDIRLSNHRVIASARTSG